MAQQTINVGTSPNDGTGTPLRTAFQYTNSNFSELYTAVGPSGNNIVVPGTATITGDLTVDTSTLKVDSANNRVGIGTASPALPLDVVGGIQVTSGSAGGLYQLAYGASASSRSWRTWNDVSANGDFQISTSTTRTGSTYSDRYRIDVTGIHEWFNTSGTAMTLNSTGLGVGASPVGRLNIANTGADVVTSMTAVGVQRWQFIVSNSTAAFSIYDQTNSATRLLIDTSGNVGVGVTPSGSGGCLQLKSGITFPATQVASSDANTLDDYEEGTFTPGITFGGASVGMTGTFAGRYTKVGRAVTINGIIALTAKGSSTGIAKISGLPFTSANASGEYTAISIRLDRVSFADFPCGYVGPNSSVVELENTTNAGTVSSMTDSNFINTSVVIVNFTYTV